MLLLQEGPEIACDSLDSVESVVDSAPLEDQVTRNHNKIILQTFVPKLVLNLLFDNECLVILCCHILL